MTSKQKKEWKALMLGHFKNEEGLASCLAVSSPTAHKYINFPLEMKVKHLHLISVDMGTSIVELAKILSDE
jgi:hypothetical protein